jgi:hypothetical protein
MNCDSIWQTFNDTNSSENVQVIGKKRENKTYFVVYFTFFFPRHHLCDSDFHYFQLFDASFDFGSGGVAVFLFPIVFESAKETIVVSEETSVVARRCGSDSNWELFFRTEFERYKFITPFLCSLF